MSGITLPLLGLLLVLSGACAHLVRRPEQGATGLDLLHGTHAAFLERGPVSGVIGVQLRSAAPPALPPHYARGAGFFALKHADADAAGTLDELRALPSQLPGVDTVTLAFMWYVDDASASHVAPSAKHTPNISQVMRFVDVAHEAGLRVLLKPTVVATSGAIMPDLDPANVTEFFATYSELLLAVAVEGSLHGLDMLSVGLELQKLSTAGANLGHWQALVQSVRAVFKGKLTYCSNPLTDETPGIPVALWSQLDFVAIDIYVPLILSRTPLPDNFTFTMSQFEMNLWFDFVLEMHVLKWYRNTTLLASNVSIFVSEFGYPSCIAGMLHPWLDPDNCTASPLVAPNATLQAMAYTAALTAFAAQPAVFAGVTQFWMGQPGTSDYYGNRSEAGSNWACGWPWLGKPETVAVLRAAYAPDSR